MLLIDADILLYRCMHKYLEDTTVYKSLTGDDDFTLGDDPLDRSTNFVTSFIQDLKDVCGSRGYMLVFSGRHNYRKMLVPSYKSHRTPLNPEQKTFKNELQRLLCATHPNRSINHLEADDTIGILSEIPGSIICSIDKDMLQIPGNHYNWNTQEQYHIDHEEAEYNFMLQTLMGDSADGYPGIKGIGIKKGRNILKRGVSWDVVVQAYKDNGLTYDDALRTAWLAKILVPGEYEQLTHSQSRIHLYKGPPIYI